jgi:pyrroline-5-carboxylate reductase
VLSIAAGRRIEGLEAHLPAGAAVVRAMPNMPATIGRGITVAVANAQVSPAQRALAGELLSAAGGLVWVEDEALLDPVTAVSGSGPAYVFLLVECLAEAGRAAGLDAGLAERLARATVTGSAALLEQSDLSASTLRENVTSPGGTTAAALAILAGPDGLQELMTAAVIAATKRGRELAK